MIEASIQKGLKAICFTDHYDKDDDQWGEGEQIFDVDEYFTTMTRLREQYRDQIEVWIGVELGLDTHLAEYYSRFVPKYPFDMVIGSVLRFTVQTRRPKSCLKERLMRKYTG